MIYNIPLVSAPLGVLYIGVHQVQGKYMYRYTRPRCIIHRYTKSKYTNICIGTPGIGI